MSCVLSWVFASAVLAVGAPGASSAVEPGHLVLTPPALDLPAPTPPGLEGLAGGGYGYVIARGRAEPGLSALEFLLDWVLRIGEGAATLEALTYGGYYGGLYQPSPTYLVGALAWEVIHPLIDTLLVWGIGSASDWFAPRYFWTLLGAYAGSIVGGAFFWLLTLAFPDGYIVWGLLGTAIASSITVGTQTQTKVLRHPYFRRRPPPPPWRGSDDVEPPPAAQTLSAAALPSVKFPPFLAVEF